MFLLVELVDLELKAAGQVLLQLLAATALEAEEATQDQTLQRLVAVALTVL
jgi:hypothetical protein